MTDYSKLLLDEMAGGGETDPLMQRLAMARALRGTPMPQGQRFGDVYTPPSGVEMLGGAMGKILGAVREKQALGDLEKRQADRKALLGNLVSQQEQERAAAQRAAAENAEHERQMREREFGLKQGADARAAQQLVEIQRHNRATENAGQWNMNADLGLAMDARTGRTRALPKAVGAKPDKAAEAAFKDAGELRKEFSGQQVYKDTQALATAYQKVQGASDNAAGDMGLIFGYMRLLDPGSTVREGEFLTAQNAAGIDDKTRNFFNRIIAGERLAPAQRTQFKAEAEKLLRSQVSRLEPLQNEYRRLATQRGVKPEDVVLDLGLPKFEAPAGGPTVVERVKGPNGFIERLSDGTFREVSK